MPTWFFRLPAAILLLTPPLVYSQQTPHQLTGVAPSSQLRSYTTSPSAKKCIVTSVGDFALWVDEEKWKQHYDVAAGHLEFSNVKSGVIVTVIAEDTRIPTEGLRELVLTNAKSAAPNAKITSEEKRIVNGREVLALQMAVTIKGIPFKILGYYHGGTSGAIQVVGSIVEPALSDNIEDVTEFLNGLEIADEDLPSTGILCPGLLRFNSRIAFKYDPKKWEPQQGSDDEDSFDFTYSSAYGDAEAHVQVERQSIPIGALPTFVLSNAQDVDPNARIIFKKERRVNGVTMWFLKLALPELQSNTIGTPLGIKTTKIPTIAFGYFYTGKAGTAQVITSTKTSLLPKYEKDFMDFLNGLLVSE
jgi:hypothetical protein